MFTWWQSGPDIEKESECRRCGRIVSASGRVTTEAAGLEQREGVGRVVGEEGIKFRLCCSPVPVRSWGLSQDCGHSE